MPLTDLTDLELVHRIKGGDPSLFGELVARHERKIFRLIYHITRNREDAEDALQEAFLKAFTKLDQFHEGSQFYTWLVRIAVNEALIHLRKRRNTPMTFSLDERVKLDDNEMPLRREIGQWDDNPETRCAQQEIRAIFDRALQTLPEIFRTVLVLRDREQRSTEEAAQTLGISVAATKSRLLRAKAAFAEAIRGIAKTPLRVPCASTRLRRK